MSTRLLRPKIAAERVGWHPQHMWKVATDPDYAHVGFPRPVRLGRNSVAFVENEIEAWLEARIAERDEKGFEPKRANPRERSRRARERKEARAE